MGPVPLMSWSSTRLTASPVPADFAKLVELFDACGCSGHGRCGPSRGRWGAPLFGWHSQHRGRWSDAQRPAFSCYLDRYLPRIRHFA
jgi:hypothetical protein